MWCMILLLPLILLNKRQRSFSDAVSRCMGGCPVLSLRSMRVREAGTGWRERPSWRKDLSTVSLIQWKRKSSPWSCMSSWRREAMASAPSSLMLSSTRTRVWSKISMPDTQHLTIHNQTNQPHTMIHDSQRWQGAVNVLYGHQYYSFQDTACSCIFFHTRHY